MGNASSQLTQAGNVVRSGVLGAAAPLLDPILSPSVVGGLAFGPVGSAVSTTKPFRMAERDIASFEGAVEADIDKGERWIGGATEWVAGALEEVWADTKKIVAFLVHLIEGIYGSIAYIIANPQVVLMLAIPAAAIAWRVWTTRYVYSLN